MQDRPRGALLSRIPAGTDAWPGIGGGLSWLAAFLEVVAGVMPEKVGVAGILSDLRPNARPTPTKVSALETKAGASF